MLVLRGRECCVNLLRLQFCLSVDFQMEQPAVNAVNLATVKAVLRSCPECSGSLCSNRGGSQRPCDLQANCTVLTMSLLGLYSKDSLIRNFLSGKYGRQKGKKASS